MTVLCCTSKPWDKMTCRQKVLGVSCCLLIVSIPILLWVRFDLMGCSCPKQFGETCESYMNSEGIMEEYCECLCDGRGFFSCEYTCPGCRESDYLPQAGCCWGEDGSWGSDKEREGCSIQYCGQAPCDGQDVRDAKNTHWTQHPLYAMAALWWPVLLIACFCCCACCCVCCAGGRGPTDAAPTLTAAPSPALGAQEVGETVEEESEGEAEADPGSAPDPVLQGLNVLLSFFEEESEGKRPTRAPQHGDT